jgi:hypothetical protein
VAADLDALAKSLAAPVASSSDRTECPDMMASSCSIALSKWVLGNRLIGAKERRPKPTPLLVKRYASRDGFHHVDPISTVEKRLAELEALLAEQDNIVVPFKKRA